MYSRLHRLLRRRQNQSNSPWRQERPRSKNRLPRRKLRRQKPSRARRPNFRQSASQNAAVAPATAALVFSSGRGVIASSMRLFWPPTIDGASTGNCAPGRSGKDRCGGFWFRLNAEGRSADEGNCGRRNSRTRESDFPFGSMAFGCAFKARVGNCELRRGDILLHGRHFALGPQAVAAKGGQNV